MNACVAPQACCFNVIGGTAYGSCAVPAACSGGGGTPIACTGAMDCPGAMCCLTPVGPGGVIGSQCAPACSNGAACASAGSECPSDGNTYTCLAVNGPSSQALGACVPVNTDAGYIPLPVPDAAADTGAGG
jgi:hypothetical protein